MPEDFKLLSASTALTLIREMLKHLKQKEDEVNDPNSIQTVPAAPKPEPVKLESSNSVLKNEPMDEDPIKEEGKGLKKVYSTRDTRGKLYLKRIQSLAEAKKPSRIVKYPLVPTFWSTGHHKRNILITSRHDVRKLARSGGLTACDGFNYNAKANQTVWPYPCPRPTFKTAWLYRTAGMSSLHSVSMQLRIMWMCIKWDDMNTKAPNPDGKNQVTNEAEIVTSEILKHRNIGRFLELTQYFQRRVSIPLDAPRKQVDYSPIRSGLRKRKRVESPVQAEPQVGIII